MITPLSKVFIVATMTTTMLATYQSTVSSIIQPLRNAVSYQDDTVNTASYLGLDCASGALQQWQERRSFVVEQIGALESFSTTEDNGSN
jgi:hypothetical protein